MFICPKLTEHLYINPGHFLGSTSNTPLDGKSCAPNPYSLPCTIQNFPRLINIPLKELKQHNQIRIQKNIKGQSYFGARDISNNLIF